MLEDEETIEQDPRLHAAYLAVHSLFGERGAAAFDVLRAVIGDTPTDALVAWGAGEQKTRLEARAAELTAEADKITKEATL